MGAPQPRKPTKSKSPTGTIGISGDRIARPMKCMVCAHSGEVVTLVHPVRVRDVFGVVSASFADRPKPQVASGHGHRTSTNWADAKPPIGTPWPPWRSMRRPNTKRVPSSIPNRTCLVNSSSEIETRSVEDPRPGLSSFFYGASSRLWRRNHCSAFLPLTECSAHLRARSASPLGISRNASPPPSISMGTG